MKFSFKKAAVLGALSFSLVCMSCSDDTTTSPSEVTKPGAPTALMANSKNETSIALKWTAPTAAPAKYIIWTYEKGASDPVFKDSTTSVTFVKSGLSMKEYTFRVWSKDTALQISNTYATITWAPAYRFNSVFMYETASSNYGSGLQLFDSAAGTPLNLKVVDGKWWDLYLDTRNNEYWIGSPNKSSYTITEPNATPLYIYTNAQTNAVNNYASLDDVWDTALPTPTTATSWDCTTPSVTNGFILVAKAYNNSTGVYSNYAKILVKVKNGSILQGAEPNRYVEMDISYQKLIDAPYAK